MLKQPTMKRSCRRTDCFGHLHNAEGDMVSRVVEVDGCHSTPIRVQANYTRDGWHFEKGKDKNAKSRAFVHCLVLPARVQEVLSRMVKENYDESF